MGFLMETDYQIRKLRPWSVSHHPRDLLQGPGSRAAGYCSMVRAPRPMAHASRAPRHASP
ncbi:uncharacterized protein METZ01_LOCUS338628, partial [marine metagenome]